MTYALSFFVVFFRIGLAVTQQRNIEEGRVFRIPPTSMITTVFDCATYGLGASAYVTHNWLQVFFMGLGAGAGSLVAIWLDRKWHGG